LLKFAVLFQILLITMSAPGAVVQHHFKNGAILDYGFNERGEFPSDVIRFKDPKGNFLWTQYASLAGIPVNFIENQVSDPPINPFDTNTDRTAEWFAFNRNRQIKVDSSSDLVPLVDGEHKLWISSTGEILPIEMSLSTSYFMKGNWKQYRWELPDKSFFRAVVEYEDLKEITGRINQIVLIRESDWSYIHRIINDKAVGQALYESDLSLYLNPDASIITFNAGQFDETYKSPTFNLRSMEKIYKASSIPLFHLESTYLTHVRSLVSSGNGLYLMSKNGESPQRILSDEEKILEEEIRSTLATPGREFSGFPGLAAKISKEGQSNISIDLEKDLAAVIYRELMGLPNGNVDYHFVDYENRGEIHTFVKSFFSAINLMYATNGSDFTVERFLNSSAMLAFDKTYTGLIIRGFKNLPRFPAQFTNSDYDAALRLLRMCHNIREINKDLAQILEDYQVSRSGKNPRYSEIARERIFLLSIKSHNVIEAMNFIGQSDVTLDQLVEIVHAYGAEPSVLLKAAERVIQLKRYQPDLNLEKVNRFLAEINKFIPTDAVEYGRFARIYSDYYRQLAPVNEADYANFDKEYGAQLRRELTEECSRALVIKPVLKKTGT
jgi:hypothetical protein